MEFETLNSVINLGSMALFMAVYFAKVVILCIAYVSYGLTSKKKPEFVAKNLKSAFFNELIVLATEGSIDIAISGYLQTLRELKSWEYFGDSVSIFIGHFCKFLIAALFITFLYVAR